MAQRKNGPPPTTQDLVLQKGLPCNPQMEQFILGSVLLDNSKFDAVLVALSATDFSLEANRRIFSAMKNLSERRSPIDTGLLAEELMRLGQLESVGGLAYISSLTSGLPEVDHLAQHIAVVKEKSGLRQVISAGQRMIDRALIAESGSQEIIDSVTSQLQEIATSTKAEESDGGQTVAEFLQAFDGGLGAFMDPSTRKLGIPTGYRKLDEMTGGFHEGELIVVAARPSLGKTSFMTNLVEFMALKKHKFPVVFSLEMSIEANLTRMMCSVARVDHQKFRLGFLSKEERHRLQQALYELNEMRFKIYDKSGIQAHEIISTTRRLVMDEGAHIVFIDYLGLVGFREHSENRNQEIGKFARNLKLLAMECQIPIVILSQLSRAPEKRGGSFRPILSDLRDSGEVENHSDVVMFLFRPELYSKDRSDVHGKAEVIISKQRNGPIGTVPLMFRHSMMRFENPAEGEE